MADAANELTIPDTSLACIAAEHHERRPTSLSTTTRQPSTVGIIHLPYPEAHSTSMWFMKVRRFHWEHDAKNPANRLYWLFAWFPLDPVFRAGEV